MKNDNWLVELCWAMLCVVAAMAVICGVIVFSAENAPEDKPMPPEAEAAAETAATEHIPGDDVPALTEYQPEPEDAASPVFIGENLFSPKSRSSEMSEPADLSAGKGYGACDGDIYREDVPLSRELQYHLWEVCQEAEIDSCLALALIECESGFNPDAVSKTGDVGLCQLSKGWHAENLTPAENITTGIWYLRTLIERYYGDQEAALTAYNAGTDTGSRTYARAVLSAAEKWKRS